MPENQMEQAAQMVLAPLRSDPPAGLIFDLNKVMWAIGYRLKPSRDIITFPGWHSPLDPSEHPKDRVHEAIKKGDRLLLDCTKPIDWPRTPDWFGERFPPLAYPDDDTMRKVREGWSKYGIKA